MLEPISWAFSLSWFEFLNFWVGVDEASRKGRFSVKSCALGGGHFDLKTYVSCNGWEKNLAMDYLKHGGWSLVNQWCMCKLNEDHSYIISTFYFGGLPGVLFFAYDVAQSFDHLFDANIWRSPSHAFQIMRMNNWT